MTTTKLTKLPILSLSLFEVREVSSTPKGGRRLRREGSGTTPFVVFSVTCFFEIAHCYSYLLWIFFSDKCQFGCLDIVETLTSLLGKKDLC